MAQVVLPPPNLMNIFRYLGRHLALGAVGMAAVKLCDVASHAGPASTIVLGISLGLVEKHQNMRRRWGMIPASTPPATERTTPHEAREDAAPART